MINLSLDATHELMYWLASHESDIALGINDFGDLRGVFKQLTGRDALWGTKENVPVLDADDMGGFGRTYPRAKITAGVTGTCADCGGDFFYNESVCPCCDGIVGVAL